jgi:hypothetical protein
MSDLIELVLSLVVGLGDLGDLPLPDTKATRIFWGVILVLLGGVIWRELS